MHCGLLQQAKQLQNQERSAFVASIQNWSESTGVFRNKGEETKYSADVHRSALRSFLISLLSISITARLGTRLVLQIVVTFHTFILRCSMYMDV